jgi:hypothetical protein
MIDDMKDDLIEIDLKEKILSIYRYKSDTKRIKNVIPEHGEKAGKLVKIALESKDAVEFAGKRAQYPSLNDVYIPEKTWKLFVNEEGTLKLQDEIYLETCLHLVEDELATMDGELTNGHEYRAQERYGAVRMHQSLKEALKTL